MIKPTRWMIIVILGIALGAGIIPAGAQNDASRRTEWVAMPDGVRLATDLYLPTGGGPWPVLLIRTPYGRGVVGDDTTAGNLMSAGIALVSQDVRGRGESEGVYGGFFDDHADGQAMIDWILKQPWSSGVIATFGGSAMGIAEYMLAPGAPDALRCQWIEVGTPDVYDAVYQGGAYRSELVDGWLAGIDEQHLRDPWQANALNSAYWDSARITDFSQVHASAVHVGGWYDIFARETIDGFLGYQFEGGAGAAGRQHLIMGPWTHGVNLPQVGDLTFAQGVLDVQGWFGQWLDACLVGSTRSPATIDDLDTLPTVTYFTMGAVGEDGAPGSAWHTAKTWPPAGGNDVALYLRPDHNLSEESPGADGGGDTFTYNPADPSPTICGANLNEQAGSCDQRPVEQRADVIVYSSTPLAQPVEVTGDLRVKIWISTDVPDTDLVVRLTDVYPDGRSMLVLDSIFRARYARSPDFTTGQPLEPGVPVLLTFDLGPTSIIFNTGHRIRVSLTSSNAPRFAPNPNTGAMFLGDGDAGQIAHTTILHDADHPSAIILPMTQPSAPHWAQP